MIRVVKLQSLLKLLLLHNTSAVSSRGMQGFGVCLLRNKAVGFTDLFCLTCHQSESLPFYAILATNSHKAEQRSLLWTRFGVRIQGSPK